MSAATVLGRSRLTGLPMLARPVAAYAATTETSPGTAAASLAKPKRTFKEKVKKTMFDRRTTLFVMRDDPKYVSPLMQFFEHGLALPEPEPKSRPIYGTWACTR